MRIDFSKLDDFFCDNWRKAWKWFSVQLHLFACSVLIFLQLAPVIPEEVKALIPEPWGLIVTGLWTIFGLFARLKRQQV